MSNSVIGNLDSQVWRILGINTPKILVTGISGQLGHDVCRELEKRGIEYVGASRKDFDLTNENQIKEFMEKHRPTTVIHCGAYTAVDKAEDEQELCFAVNEKSTQYIAEACQKLDCKMLYISTDYVFPGTGDSHYETTDETAPQNIYGKSKLAGENAVKDKLHKYFIVRISWVFGENGNNFIKTMLRVGKDKESVNVVSDQVGSPTYTKDLAPLLCNIAMSDKFGTYHATNEGVCSWAELAEAAFKVAGYTTKVNHITTAEYPTKATRPMNSRMSKKSLEDNGFEKLRSWEEAVEEFVKNFLKC